MIGNRACTYLQHMQEAVRQALEFIEGMDREEFLDDKRTQQAVILNLMVLGEAASKLLTDDAELIKRHPEIPWRSIKGMRNRIAHGYFEINLDVVWTTTQDDLPKLRQLVNRVIAAECPPHHLDAADSGS